MTKYEASTFFINHAAALLERVASNFREKGGWAGCEGCNLEEIQKMVSLSLSFKYEDSVNHDQASAFAEAVSYAGPLPEGVRQAFAALTGYEFKSCMAPELTKVQ